MTLLSYDSIFLEHDTGNHPECPERLQVVWEQLTRRELDQRCATETWEMATLEQLSRVHDPSYVDVIQKSSELGGGQIEPDTVVSPLSHHVALQASGAVCHSIDQVIAGKHRNALCLVRPPGHHARPRNAMGFCLFNHIAVGAKHATEGLGVDRVLVVDWDVHHGNGTQESFYEDEQIGFLSIHRAPFYPGTGSPEETGRGPGLGTTRNIALEFGVSRQRYLEEFTRGLEELCRKMRPELILISAGFDAHRSDPIGSLGLEVDDFAELTRSVMAAAQEYGDGRVVSTLEGGYNPHVLADCVEAHLLQLLQAEA